MAHLCPSCFEANFQDSCPICGFTSGQRRSSLLLPIGAKLRGHYVIGRRLGNPGGFGITYLGYHQVLECKVAIKEFLPRELAGRSLDGIAVELHSEADSPIFQAGLQQFLQEARLLAKFNHPHIVRVIDFFEENNTAYLVMEYYSGVTLVNFVERNGGCLHEQAALDILLPILDGLQEVHARGILHRDIKPQNIYVTSRGYPILLDFGSARHTVEALSQGFTLLVTPGYAPIEQYDRQGQQGPWTDVYGCAATLYYMLSGNVPPDAISRMANDTFIPAAELCCSLHIRHALTKGLALQPQDRPQTLALFRSYLLEETQDPEATLRLTEDCTQSLSQVVRSHETFQTAELHPTKIPLRRKWFISILVILVFAISAGFWQYQQMNPIKQLAQRGVPFSDDAYFRAVKTGDETVVKLFLQAGVGINHANADGVNALMSAVEAGQFLMVKFLISQGAVLDTRDQQNRSAVDIALKNGNIPILKLLMEQLKLGPDSIDASTNMTFLEKAIFLGNLQSVKYLIDQGANLEAKDSSGRTLLDRVLAAGNQQAASLLKAAGAKRNVNNQFPAGLLTEVKFPPGDTTGFTVDLLGNGIGQNISRRQDGRNSVVISQEGVTLAAYPNLRSSNWYVAYLRDAKIPDLVYLSLSGSEFLDEIKIIGKTGDQSIGMLFAPDLGALRSMGLLRGQAGIELVGGRLVLFSGKNRVAVVWNSQQRVFQMQRI